jgi:hypothetical protein
MIWLALGSPRLPVPLPTISMSKKRLGASFFFSRGGGDASHAAQVPTHGDPTLSRQPNTNNIPSVIHPRP